jgi:hypothetical protein
MPLQRLAVARQGPASAADDPAVEPGLPSGGGGCGPWLEGLAAYLAPQLCDREVGDVPQPACEIASESAIPGGPHAENIAYTSYVVRHSSDAAFIFSADAVEVYLDTKDKN